MVFSDFTDEHISLTFVRLFKYGSALFDINNTRCNEINKFAIDVNGLLGRFIAFQYFSINDTVGSCSLLALYGFDAAAGRTDV